MEQELYLEAAEWDLLLDEQVFGHSIDSGLGGKIAKVHIGFHTGMNCSGEERLPGELVSWKLH